MRKSWLVAAALSSPLGAAAQPVRIGLNAWAGYEELWLAEQLGYYREEGLDVRVIQFESLTEGRRAFERGNIDVLPATLGDVLPANAGGLVRARVVAAVDYSYGGDAILAADPIASVKELRGRRVGLEMGSVNLFVLARALEKNGMTVSDLKIVNVAQNKMQEAFRDGLVDAVVTYPPFLVQLQNLPAPKVRQVFSSRDIPEEIIDVIAVSEQFLNSQPAAVEKVLKVFWRTRAQVAANPDKTIPMMAKREGITVEEFKSILANDIRLLYAADSKRILDRQKEFDAMAESFGKVLVQIGAIRDPRPGFASNLIHVIK